MGELNIGSERIFTIYFLKKDFQKGILKFLVEKYLGDFLFSTF